MKLTLVPSMNNLSVSPICLPKPNQEFDDKIVMAAGWGRFAAPHQNESQSPTLQMVSLTVSPKRYTLYKMFGTYLGKGKNNVVADVCSGDSGGPLMFYDDKKWTLIGKKSCLLKCKLLLYLFQKEP